MSVRFYRQHTYGLISPVMMRQSEPIIERSFALKELTKAIDA